MSACPLCGGRGRRWWLRRSRGRRLWWPWRRHGQLAVILRIWCYSFGGIVGGCPQFRLQFSLELFERGTDQGDSLSIAGCRGNRSCVQGIFLKLTVDKRSFGRLSQIARTEVIEAPHKGALHTSHIGFTERFDAGQLLRVRQGGSSTQRGNQDCTTRSPRRAGHGQVQPQKRNKQRTIDGQRTGTAGPLWRHLPPINPIFGSGISPQARSWPNIQPLDQFRPHCGFLSG